MEYDLNEVKDAIKNCSENSTIYIGCDSKKFRRKNVGYIVYATVIVIHYDSNHGGKIFDFQRVERDYGSLRQRLLNEVIFTCEIGYELLESIGDRKFEVHLDLNPSPNHKSNIVVKEACGYVMGVMGCTPKLKPESFASSTAADKLVVRFSRPYSIKKYFNKLENSK